MRGTDRATQPPPLDVFAHPGYLLSDDGSCVKHSPNCVRSFRATLAQRRFFRAAGLAPLAGARRATTAPAGSNLPTFVQRLPLVSTLQSLPRRPVKSFRLSNESSRCTM